MVQPERSILLTGATGYLGKVLAAGLLNDTDVRLILPVRTAHTANNVLERIASEIEPTTHAGWRHRVQIVPLPPIDDIPALASMVRLQHIDAIVHAAGCVDYFHRQNLDAGNVELTSAFVRLGQELNVGRFAFISTAFSSGFSDGLIPEVLHDEDAEDPTDYTRSKRRAEQIVAKSGLPYLIARPSVVIGDSRNGHYRGKRYGIYQLWAACEKIMCSDYVPEIFAIAPETPLPLLHQDAFRDGFLTAFERLPPNRIIHLVSRHDTLPTVRELWDSWLCACNRPRVIHYYQRLDDVPMERLSRRQQLWVELTAVNLDISTRAWHFARQTLDDLIGDGLSFPEVTHKTIEVCQRRFISDSPRVGQFIKRFAAERAVTPVVIEHWDHAASGVA